MKLAILLISSLVAVAGTQAATSPLYESGWEASPASPAWTVANVFGQNGWQESGGPVASAARHRIVVRGTPDASPFSTPIPPARGNQFHRFTASSSTVTNNSEWAWTDLTGAFTARPAGYDRLIGSIDMFVPSGDSLDGSVYGLLGYEDGPDGNGGIGNFLDFGFFIVPNTRSIQLLMDGTVATSVAGAFSYDKWFTISITADYGTGAINILTNGTLVPGLVATNSYIPDSSFTDLDLFCQNSKSSPNPRVVFSDNYRVLVEQTAPPVPQLKIEPGAIGEWHLSWSGLYWDWILESTQDIGAATWTNEGVTPSILSGVASVDLTDAPPRTFYRLRKP